MSNYIIDVIIIGTGPSSLYLAHKLQNKYKNILLIEKNNKIGGRTGNFIFENTEVVKGAGVGRYNKDKILLNLINEFNIKYKKFSKDFGNADSKFISKNLYLLNKYYNDKYKILTFSEFAKLILGKYNYEKLKYNLGYTDFELSDVKDTLNNYGFEDIYKKGYNFSFSWNKLCDCLAKNKNIIFNSEIIKLKNYKNYIKLYDNCNKVYFCKKLVICGNILTLRNLLKLPIYNNIDGQPFIRVYIKTNKIITSKFVLSKNFQKIIPINIEKKIYMLYADNNFALDINTFSKSKIQDLLSKEFNLDLEIIKYKKIFWRIGTHYYKPLPIEYNNRIEFIHKAQQPNSNIFVIGEVVSINQGWTNSGLESVEKIIKYF